MSEPFTGPGFFPALGPANGSTGAIRPDGWDRGMLNGQVLPGLCRISRGSIRLKIDKKNKPGADGANPTFHGIEPQPLELEVLTLSDEDRETLASIARNLVPKPGKTPSPVSIDHPSIRHLGIASVLVVGVGALVTDGPMRAKMSFDLLHWLPPTKKNATNTAKGAPKRTPPNVRNGAQANPSPTKQPGIGGPPANFTPADTNFTPGA